MLPFTDYLNQLCRNNIFIIKRHKMRSFLKALIILFAFFILPGSALDAQETAKKENIGNRKFKKISNKKNVVIIDVRSSDEFNSGHIPGALNIDYEKPGFKDSIARLDPGKTYLLYCRTGRRSGMAGKQMRELEFKNVFHLEGGIEKWNGRIRN
jgi:phage shock protein E